MRGALAALLLVWLSLSLFSQSPAFSGGGRYYEYSVVMLIYRDGELASREEAVVRFEEINSTSFRAEATVSNRSGFLWNRMVSFLAHLNMTGGVVKVRDGLLLGPFTLGFWIDPSRLGELPDFVGTFKTLVQGECERISCVDDCRSRPWGSREELMECIRSCGEPLTNKTREYRRQLTTLDAALALLITYIISQPPYYCERGFDLSLDAMRVGGNYNVSMEIVEGDGGERVRAVSSVYSGSGWLVAATIKEKTEFPAGTSTYVIKIELEETNDESVKESLMSAESSAEHPSILPSQFSGNLWWLAIVAVVAVVAILVIVLKKLA